MNWGVMLFVLVAAAANVLGGLIILFKHDWSRRSIYALMALSAGLLMTIAIVDLIPEALSHDPENSIYILVGVITIYFFQQFISPHFHFGEETHVHGHPKTAALGALGGMLIHTFFDGLTIVLGFQVDPRLGTAILIAVLLHKIPDGLTISSIIFSLFQDRKKAIWSALLLGMSTILGALAALFLDYLPLPFEQITAMAISFSAGIFLYVSGTDLLPVVNAKEDRPISLFFLLGVLLFFIFEWGFEMLEAIDF